MMKLILIFLLTFGVNVFGAEFLIRAKGHYLDSLSPSVVNKMSEEERESYDSRTQLGDIIVVAENGHVWGGAETLPSFIIVKIPDITLEEALEYVKTISKVKIDHNGEEVPALIRHRKYYLPESIVEYIINLGGVIEILKDEIPQNILAKIIQ